MCGLTDLSEESNITTALGFDTVRYSKITIANAMLILSCKRHRSL